MGCLKLVVGETRDKGEGQDKPGRIEEARDRNAVPNKARSPKSEKQNGYEVEREGENTTRKPGCTSRPTYFVGKVQLPSTGQAGWVKMGTDVRWAWERYSVREFPSFGAVAALFCWLETAPGLAHRELPTSFVAPFRRCCAVGPSPVASLPCGIIVLPVTTAYSYEAVPFY